MNRLQAQVDALRNRLSIYEDDHGNPRSFYVAADSMPFDCYAPNFSTSRKRVSSVKL